MRFPQRLKPWMLVSAAWILPATLEVVKTFGQSHLRERGPLTVRDLLWAGLWFVYALLTPGVFAVSRRWPIARPHLARRVALHFAISILFCIAWATCAKLFVTVLGLTFDLGAVSADIQSSGVLSWHTIGVTWLN